MSTRRKQFLPRVLAIGAGESVRFPNEDPILHNVFSQSPDNAFDTGQYGRGEGKTTRFDKPGLVRVYCNVHHSMVGHILVLDTPHFTRPSSDGRFRLTDVFCFTQSNCQRLGTNLLTVLVELERHWHRKENVTLWANLVAMVFTVAAPLGLVP